ncbi:hypothetical protein [Paenibacillus humicus]|uniref:hypothetical protein n=1 Tax=Paenibacillus humicus TaxID=412861 RepID=UPI000FD7886A|nr:hypothetical protein [Paenibacillus humicus]
MKKTYLWKMGLFILLMALIVLYIFLARDKTTLSELLDRLDKDDAIVSVQVSKKSRDTSGKIEINITDKNRISAVLNALSEIKTVPTRNGPADSHAEFTYQIALLDKDTIAMGMNFQGARNVDVIELNSEPTRIHFYTIMNEPDLYSLLDSFIFTG